MNLEIIVLDIETTALRSSQGHIVEIGVVLLNLDTLQITPLMNEIIKETTELDRDAWIFNNSSLNYETVLEKGKSIEEVREKLQTLFDQYPAAAYNCSFDFGWLRSRGFRIERTLPDPMILMTDICQIENYYGYKWPSCQESLDYWNINETEPHRAAGDAALEARIIVELYKSKQYPIPN